MKTRDTVRTNGYIYLFGLDYEKDQDNSRATWDGVYGTLKTKMDVCIKHLHPEEPRVLSVRETALIQGYPKSKVFYGSKESKYRQIGNSVPPPLAEALGEIAFKSWSR